MVMVARPGLILGTAQFDSRYGAAKREGASSDVCDLLSRAWSLGLSALDTAPVYADAQERIGQCGWPGTVHTKIPRDANPVFSLQQSLEKLRLGTVEVAYFHDPGVLVQDLGFFERFHKVVVPDMAQSIGISVYTPEEFNKALDLDVIGVIQVPMSVVDQRITDGDLSRATSLGKRVFARSIFLQGTLLVEQDKLPTFLSGMAPVLSRLRCLASDVGLSVMELLITAVRDRPGLSGLVIGAESPRQLDQIARAYDAPPLVEEVRYQLRSLGIENATLLDPRRWI